MEVIPSSVFFMLLGAHSNIPLCCVEFFIYLSRGILTRPNDKDTTHGWGYIPCPECFEERNRVEIHYCTVLCNPFLRSIGAEEVKLVETSNTLLDRYTT